MWNIEKIIRKGDYNYCIVRNHPRATKYGYVLHHRIVMENYLNRLLLDTEIVHHVNGDRLDNRPENLVVMDSVKHNKLHGLNQGRKYVDLVCPYCGKKFTRPHNKTHLARKGQYTMCSRRCNGKFSRSVQLKGKTHTVESAISGNILSVYIKYTEDNPEET
jgi:hypothetical protein